MIRALRHKYRAFKGDNRGVACLEFAISLPFILLILAVIVEGSRIAYAHQAASSGVRDASRYIARLAQSNICDTTDVAAANTALQADFSADAADIVGERLGNPGERILPFGVDVVSVTPNLRCRPVSYSTVDVTVVEVTATLRITFIFSNVFDLFGDPIGPITTQIIDQSRVFGI